MKKGKSQYSRVIRNPARTTELHSPRLKTTTRTHVEGSVSPSSRNSKAALNDRRPKNLVTAKSVAKLLRVRAHAPDDAER
jgi:hypothetical protein